MAELNVPDPKKGGGKVRSKKMRSSVDLTAMVDLAFLLITFFMLTTTLSKSQSMNLGMPDKTENAAPTVVADTRTVTLLLGTDNQLVWYMGTLEKMLEGPTKVGYGKNGLRKMLLEKDAIAQAMTRDPEKGLIVIIKPSDKSNYRNLIDALDEMAISKIKTYAIVDIASVELDLLKEEGLD